MVEKPGTKHSFIKRNYLKVVSLMIFLAVSGVVGGGWFRRTPQLFEATEFLMDTAITVKVFTFSERDGKQVIRKAFDEAARIECIMEPLKGNGELQRINSSPGDSWRTVSADLRKVLERSRFFYNLTGGAFDPTIASVKWLWDFENKRHVPEEQVIREKLRSVGFSKVDINDGGIRFTNPETSLDLGGVAKGYAVDRMVAVLRNSGAKAGLVNAGGDIYYFGKKPGGEDWVIGLSHPRLSRTIKVGTMPLAAVATSGDYQRFFMEDGIMYHHILDPSTGYPAHGCISVTVWAESAIDADILSTSIFVLGAEKGLELAESLEKVETLIFFENDNGVEAVMSTGVREKVRL